MSTVHMMDQRISLTIAGMEVSLATLGHALYHLNRHQHEPGIVARPEHLADITLVRDGVPMEVVEERRPSGRVFGIRGSGSERALLFDMIDEVDRDVMRVDGVLRAPHEMSYFDWMAVVSVGSAAYNVFPCFPGTTDAEVDFMTLCTEEYFRRFGHSHCGPTYDGQQTNSRHDVHVAYALMYGKFVPEHVVAWYRDGAGQRKSKASDLGGFDIVLAAPELRGSLTPEQFRFLGLFVREQAPEAASELPLTVTALKPYVDVLSRLGAGATYVDADNALTAAGLLQVQPRPETTMEVHPTDTSTLSEPVRELYAMLTDARFEAQVKRLDNDRSKGQVTEREYLRQMAIAKDARLTASPKFAVEMVAAIENRDVDYLLNVLDQADGNEISKAFMAKRYGVKIKGLNRQRRRAAIYSFCGFSAGQQADREANLTSMKNSRQQDRAAKEATELAERVNVRTPSGIKSMRQFVDDAVADGFSELIKHRNGKFQWNLFNPKTHMAMGLSVAHGGLAYAREALKLPVRTLAA